MKAVSEFNNQGTSAAAINNRHQLRVDPSVQPVNGYMPTSSNQQPKSLQLPGAVNRLTYQQASASMSSTSVQARNNATLNNMAMMTGLPPMPDVNFNDLYATSGRFGAGGRSSSFDNYDNGNNWTSTAAVAAPVHRKQTHEPQWSGISPSQQLDQNSSQLLHPHTRSVHSDLSVNSVIMDKKILSQASSTPYSAPYQTNMQQVDTMTLSHSGSSGKLRELLSSAVRNGNADSMLDGLNISPTTDPKAGNANNVLRKLLQAEDEEKCLSFTAANASYQQSSSVSSSALLTSKPESTQASPASTTTTSHSKASDHHLLKKLLSDDPLVDDSDKYSDRTRLLEKLLKDEEKETPGMRKSPSAQSPSASSNLPNNRRHSSGGSSKDMKFQTNRWEDGLRSLKRKISSSTITTSLAAAAEPDSTAPANNTILLNQLLTKPIDTSVKAAPNDITGTPLERVQARRKAQVNNNVVDVVNDKIMYGTEQINMEKFTLMVRTSENSTPAYRQSSYSSMTNGSVYDGNRQFSLNPMGTAHLQGEMMGYNRHAKDYINTNMVADQPPLHQQLPMRDALQPVGFQQENYIKTENPGSVASTSSDALLQQLLNPEENLILELESLLGGTAPTSMHLTSPEDERAIRDIEKQLLLGVENLPNSGAMYSNLSDPHSPGINLGLNNGPASASNPVLSTAKCTISHKPPPISNMGLHYKNQPFPATPQHSLRGQLQHGPPPSRGSLVAARPTHQRRQGGGPGRAMPHSAEGKLRRHSGNSPSMPPFSPLSNSTPINHSLQGGGNFSIPSNFSEMMKSTPPNIKLSQDLNSNSFPSPNEMMHHDLASPRTNKGPPNFPQSPMDVPSSPQHFRMDQYAGPSRPMLQRPSMGLSLNHQSYHADHMNIHSNHQQQMLNTGALHSPQGMRSGGASHIENINSLPPGPSNLPQYNQVDQWMLSQRVSSNSVSSSQYVKQEMRAKLTARAQQQNTSPQHQNYINQQQQALSSPHMTMMSPPGASAAASYRQSDINTDLYSSSFASSAGLGDVMDDLSKFDDDSVLPDDILNQITELRDTQNEIQKQQQQQQLQQQQHMNTMTNSNNFVNENDHDIAMKKIDQSKKESTQVIAQLRALAAGTGSSPQPDGTLTKLFRNQLARPLSKSKTSTKAEPMEVDKLKRTPQSSVSIIGVDPRPPVEEMQPNDQRNSLLQQLLTDNSILS